VRCWAISQRSLPSSLRETAIQIEAFGSPCIGIVTVDREAYVLEFNLIQCGTSDYHPEDVIAALEPLVTENRRKRMLSVLERRITSIALGVEDLANSFNGAACIRTAESLGIHDIVAAELRHPYPLPDLPSDPVTSGVNMYAHRWVDLHRLPTSKGLIQWARDRQMRILGTSPHAEMTVSDVTVDQPLLVLFGNERDGLKPETAAACDDVFRLPMYGFTESFNVSVSVAMTLADLSKRLRNAWQAEGKMGDMCSERQTFLLAQWYLSSVRRSDLVVARYMSEKTT
jgi:tRNA (guanosine-2'-O-)-methyltransferase